MDIGQMRQFGRHCIRLHARFNRGMALRLTEALSTRGVHVELFNLAVADTGKFAMSLVDAATRHRLSHSPYRRASARHGRGIHGERIEAKGQKRLRHRLLWLGGGKMVEQVTSALSGLNLDWLPPILIKGKPTEADYKTLDELAAAIEARHKQAGII